MKIKWMIRFLAVLLLLTGFAACEQIESGLDGGQDKVTQISDRIQIDGVRVTAEQVFLRGKTSFSNRVCINTELWADGALLSWWPAEDCASLQQNVWQFVVALEPQNMLQPGVHYQARAYREGEPERLAIFPFDLDGPPMEEP